MTPILDLLHLDCPGPFASAFRSIVFKAKDDLLPEYKGATILDGSFGGVPVLSLPAVDGAGQQVTMLTADGARTVVVDMRTASVALTYAACIRFWANYCGDISTKQHDAIGGYLRYLTQSAHLPGSGVDGTAFFTLTQ